jgi:branched-chain amino acid transport system substrate-binding protein
LVIAGENSGQKLKPIKKWRLEMTRRMHYFCVVACLSVLSLGLWGVALAGEPKPIKIGCDYPFSGPQGWYGQSLLNGHKLAVEEIMAKGGFLGRPVELIARDTMGRTDLSTRNCRELILKEKVDFLFGGVGSPQMFTASAVGKEYKKVTFVVGGKSAKIVEEEWHPYIFHHIWTTTVEGHVGAMLLKTKVIKGIESPKVYWIATEGEYGRSLFGPFKEKLNEMIPGAQLVGEDWPRPGETEYTPYISKILSAKPDVVVNAIWSGLLTSLLRQAEGYGLFKKTKLLSMGGTGAWEYLKDAGKSVPVGTWCGAHHIEGIPGSEEQQRFTKKYKDRFGTMWGDMSINAYYMTYLLNEGIEKAGTVDSDAVAKAMEGACITDIFGKKQCIRPIDHQVNSFEVWGPVIETDEPPYRKIDPARAIAIYCEGEHGYLWHTPEEVLAARKKK